MRVVPFQKSRDEARRFDLWQAYRLAASLKLDDVIFTHLSARSAENPSCFLINPFGFLFEEVTPRNLILVSLNDEENNAAGINPAGHIIHSALYEAREDIQAVVHFHTPASIAVASHPNGLLPFSQFSMMFYDRLSSHPFEGISLDGAEKERFRASLGNNSAMLLPHHGLLTVGTSIAEAFIRAYYLEQSCRIQLAAMQAGLPLTLPPQNIAEHTARQFEGPEKESLLKAYDALLRRMNRTAPLGSPSKI